MTPLGKQEGEASLAPAPIPLRSLFLALAAIAIIMAWICVPTIERWHAIRDESTWPSVQGTIQSIHAHGSGLVGGSEWLLTWTYSYVVEGKRYIADSDAVMFGYEGTSYASLMDAERAATLRPVSQHVAVYFDPQHPYQSVLDLPTWQTRDFSFLVLMLACVAATAQILPNLLGRRNSKLNGRADSGALDVL